MLIPIEEINKSIATENPWWETNAIPARFNNMQRRTYFAPFFGLVTNWGVNRAVILMGPRRVGKTVLLHHLIGSLLSDGLPAKNVMYVSIDTPTYTGQSLEFFLNLHLKQNSIGLEERRVIIFDEIQYLANWERHLKTLVDKNPHVRFVASGSAAAALKIASNESGAGRFTDFMLPPLTFEEYVRFIGKDYLIDLVDYEPGAAPVYPKSSNIEELNKEFVNYINYGGYPEAVASESIRLDAARYIKNDIIDKVLLRDLPQLYGIQNIQELNKLFTALAYQTAQEVSLEKLCQNSGISKPTIARYIEYLEAAFLIFRVRRVDNSAKDFSRDRSFKIFLTNPSMRAALFSPLGENSDGFGHLVETAIFSQWFHSANRENLHYARWKRSGRAKSQHGEIDLVHISREMRPDWLVEIKWSDTSPRNEAEWDSIKEFIENKHSIRNGLFTSRTIHDAREINGVECSIVPSAIYCYIVGMNTPKSRNKAIDN